MPAPAAAVLLRGSQKSPPRIHEELRPVFDAAPLDRRAAHALLLTGAGLPNEAQALREAIDAAAKARRLELILPTGFRPDNWPLSPRCSRRAATPTVRAQPQRPSNPTFSPRPNTPSSRRSAHRDG